MTQQDKLMNEDKTGRGFDLVNFIDDYNHECSLQKSSSAEDEKIWLGMDKADTNGYGRMHLTREHVRQILPYLHRFVETGEIL